MNLERYSKMRKSLLEQEQKFRKVCALCWQPEFGCYCCQVKKFDPQINFIILIHPLELRRRIATGRMSHLCLENSQLIRGHDFSENKIINQLLSDPNNESVILYPGQNSKNISLIGEERNSLFPKHKKLNIFVIDGTWATAKKMVKSRNLMGLPKISFSPNKPSNFRVRKQPMLGCYSTIEAIHHVIELLGDSRGYDTRTRRHDKLLDVFNWMVELQLEYIKISHSNPNSSYRRFKRKRPMV